MTISVGVLYGCQRLVRLCSDQRIEVDEFKASFGAIYHLAASDEVLALAQSCQWIRADTEGVLLPTDRGLRIRGAPSEPLALRHQIHDVMDISQPAWAKRASGGRDEAIKILPVEVRQCFDEAGLLGDWDDELIQWWDRAADTVRLRRKNENLKVGREAERKSIEHELRRTRRKPVWQALNSNYSGFDILSVVSSTSPTYLRIEVKGTYQPISNAYFTVTRSEWRTAETTRQYVFHLWLLKETPKRLIDVDYTFVEPHIPADQGIGAWEEARIPFRAFT